jgi:hypothetical protein
MHGVPGEKILGLGRIPAGEIDGLAVLECVADGVQHVGLDPERIASFAGPNAQTGGRNLYDGTVKFL